MKFIPEELYKSQEQLFNSTGDIRTQHEVQKTNKTMLTSDELSSASIDSNTNSNSRLTSRVVVQS